MSEADHTAWLAKQSGFIDLSVPTDENLVALLSTTMRETNPSARAQGFVDMANMCLAMVDVTLGAQSYVATCVVLNKH